MLWDGRGAKQGRAGKGRAKQGWTGGDLATRADNRCWLHKLRIYTARQGLQEEPSLEKSLSWS